MLARNPTLAGDTVEDLLVAADVARLSDHPSEALPYLQRILREHPRDERAPMAAFTLGRTLSGLGRTQEAMNMFGRVRTSWPKSRSPKTRCSDKRKRLRSSAISEPRVASPSSMTATTRTDDAAPKCVATRGWSRRGPAIAMRGLAVRTFALVFLVPQRRARKRQSRWRIAPKSSRRDSPRS